MRLQYVFIIMYNQYNHNLKKNLQQQHYPNIILCIGTPEFS